MKSTLKLFFEVDLQARVVRFAKFAEANFVVFRLGDTNLPFLKEALMDAFLCIYDAFLIIKKTNSKGLRIL